MTVLCDHEILAEINSQRLIVGADEIMIGGAYYQLRMGSVYYDLTEGAQRFALRPDQSVLIKPGHRVVLITVEELIVPADMLVRIVSKGSLFSIGLSPVATYADPGFKGNLGIVTENISDKYIELSQGEPIAKADFTRLSTPATRLYHGQHGFQAGIWPLKTHLQKVHKEVAGDARVRSEKEEAFALLPAATRTVICRLEQTQMWIDIALVFAICINAATLFLIGGKLMDNFYGIITNLISAAIVAVGTIVVRILRRSR